MDFKIKPPVTGTEWEVINEAIIVDTPVVTEVSSIPTNAVVTSDLTALTVLKPNTETVQELLNNPAVAATLKEQMDYGSIKWEEFEEELKVALTQLQANIKWNIAWVKELFSMVCNTEEAEQEIKDVLDKYTGMDGWAMKKWLKEMDEWLNDIKPYIWNIKDAVEWTRNAFFEFVKSDAKLLASSFSWIKGRVTDISWAFKWVDSNLDIADEILWGSIPRNGKRVCLTEAMIAALDKIIPTIKNSTQNEMLTTVKNQLVYSNATLKRGMEQLVFIQKNQLLTRLTQEANKFELFTRLPVTIGINVTLWFQAAVFEMGNRMRGRLDEMDEENQILIDKVLTYEENDKAEYVNRLTKVADGIDWLHNRIQLSDERIEKSKEITAAYIPEFNKRVDASSKGILTMLSDNETGWASIKQLIAGVQSEINEVKEKYPDVTIPGQTV